MSPTRVLCLVLIWVILLGGHVFYSQAGSATYAAENEGGKPATRDDEVTKAVEPTSRDDKAPEVVEPTSRDDEAPEAVEPVETPEHEIPAWTRLPKQWHLPEDMRLGNLKRFGADLFAQAGGEEPRTLNMPISPQYALGPGDELAIRVWSKGIEHVNTTAMVSPDGKLYLPLLGEVIVAGKPLGALQQVIEQQMGEFYIGSRTSVTVSSTRVVTVYVTGDVVKPGRYGLHGTATVLTALYVAGGPTDAGSLRNIRLSRRGQPSVDIDLYPYLLSGELLTESLLETGDTVFVGPVAAEIGVTGEVRRPGRYETAEPITCAEAIKLAGGFAAEGSNSNVRIWRIADHDEQLVINVNMSGSAGDGEAKTGDFPVQAGDVVVVSPVDPMPANAVRITGAITKPGLYQVETGMTLGQLIQKAGGLDEGAFLGYGMVRRLDAQRQHRYESFSVESAVEQPAASLSLRPYDEVYIYYRREVTPITDVQVRGPVQQPGKYEWAADMRVRDLVVQAGGVKDNAYLKQARLLRLQPSGDRIVLSIALQEVLAEKPDSNIELQAGDILEILSQEEARPARLAHIAGFVQRPDSYPRFEGMKVSDLVFAAGGLAPGAGDQLEYAPGRQTGTAQIQVLSLAVGAEERVQVEPDLVLKDDDQITVVGKGDFAARPPVVHVRGQVERPGAHILRSSAEQRETLYNLLQRVGPLLDDANPDGIMILRPTEMAMASGSQQSLEQIVHMYNQENSAEQTMMLDEMQAERAVMAEQVTRNVAYVVSGESGTSIVLPPRRISLTDWVTAIPVEGSQILASKGQEADIELHDMDTVIVPELSNSVTVLGAVIRPGQVRHREKASPRDYANMAGGLASDAAFDHAVVVRANSAVHRIQEIKDVHPGDIIVVPSRHTVRTIRTESTWERVLKSLGSVAATFLLLR